MCILGSHIHIHIRIHIHLSLYVIEANQLTVERAIRLGKRRCHIVVYDWFEDCLLGPAGKKSLKYEKPYTLDRVITRLAKGLELTPEYFSRFKEGVRAAEELVDNSEFYDAFLWQASDDRSSTNRCK